MDVQRFGARIAAGPRGRGVITVPFDPDEAWGAKAGHPVGGSINGRCVRGTVTPDGRGWVFTVTPMWMRDTGVAAGDDVIVELAPEGPQRGDLADDIAAALAANPAAAAFFDTLAQFYRKAYLRWIDATTRRPDLRAARIAEVTDLLAAGIKQRPRSRGPAEGTGPAYDDVVDLGRYPVNAPSSPAYRHLVQTCQEQLRRHGVAQLTGFLTPAAVTEMLALAGQLAGQAWASDQSHTVYFEPPDDCAGPDHPRALLQHSAKKAIAFDQIPPGAPIRRLYESDDLTGFIAAVLGKPVLYRSADPLDALEIAVFSDGDELGWHFDNSEFSVTVMYQESDAGGHFDYCPGLRTEHDQNYPGVQKILLGGSDGVTRLPASPGTLAVFRGQHALHRVTPVSGPRPRINSVLTYGEHPGMKLSELTQRLFYGRTA